MLFIFQKNLEIFVEGSYDLIALLLCYHISLRYILMCHKRAVPALDSYWNKMEPLIMSRFVATNFDFTINMIILLHIINFQFIIEGLNM